MGRAPCCDKANVKKGPWSPEEDAKLKSYIEQHGTGGNWIALPHKIGLKRCGKSCRLRWLNYLRPNIKHGGFSEEEDNIICSLYITIGSRWSIIAAQLPGRTDNDIKNYWNTRLKKKLLGKQRKEQARRACLKQEIKSDFNSFNVEPNFQAPYLPEMPLNLPVMEPYGLGLDQFESNQEAAMVVKPEAGKLSAENNFHLGSNLYADSSLINMPLTSYGTVSEAYPSLFPTSSLENLGIDLEPALQGFDMVSVSSTSGSSASTTTSSMETMNWENVNSLLYHHHPQVSDQYVNSYFEA